MEYFDDIHNGGTQITGVRSKTLHLITHIHEFVGYIFCALSIIHIVINWKALKSYFKKK
jgi:hypothetical protein